MKAEDPLFTVLLPVNRPPALLPYAIESVLRQTETRFELFVISDGAPWATGECADAFAERDNRIRVFRFPKGERHGEVHRHTALEAASGRFVAQIGDDDLWFPDCLDELAALLADVDFGNLLQAELSPMGNIRVHIGDLGDPEVRARMCEKKWNFFGPTCAAYRLAAYRQLPVGWSAAPVGLWTDLHMWRKFLVMPGLNFGTRMSIQGIKLPQGARRNMTLEARAAEMKIAAAMCADSKERAKFHAAAIRALFTELRQEQLRKVRDAVAMAESQRAEFERAREELAAAIEVQRIELENAKAAIAATEASRSWKITKPQRWIARAFARWRR